MANIDNSNVKNRPRIVNNVGTSTATFATQTQERTVPIAEETPLGSVPDGKTEIARPQRLATRMRKNEGIISVF